MKRSMQIYYLCLSAFGGFLAFPAIPKYAVAVLVSVAFAWIAYKKMLRLESRKTLLILSGSDVVVGVLVGLLFPDPLGISGTGIAIILGAWIVNAYIIVRIYKQEGLLDANEPVET